MRGRLLGLGVGLAAVTLGCGPSGNESCAAPRLVIEPASSQPREEVMVTWIGPFECDGDRIVPWGGVVLGIAAWPPNSGEPIGPPDFVVLDWATFSFGEFDRSGTARLPGDLPPGGYYLVSLLGVSSDRFDVG
jgi:hypothetical protein